MSKNRTLTICVGIPGSGKSTWATKFAKENPSWVRISRDDFRFMLKDSPILDGRGEQLVTVLVNEACKKALLSFNVILDATHVKRSYINEVVKTFGEMADINFKVFDVPLDVCLERDAERARSVGRGVIERMHQSFETLKSEFAFADISKFSRIKKNHSAYWDPLLPNVIISDIDGTVAHMNGKRGPFEWSKVGVDDPDHSVINVLRTWTACGEKLIMVSGRDESCRKETEEWLKINGVHFYKLFMRPAGDYRKDSLIKAEIYENELKGKYNIIMIYDDRDQVVETWRNLGLKCAQVEPGAF